MDYKARSCVRCESLYTPTREWQRYCSRQCARSAPRHRAQVTAWRLAHPEKFREYTRRYEASLSPERRESDRRKLSESNKRKRLRRKLTAYDRYGGPVCACCGEQELKFLSLDHVNNDGAAHRKEMRRESNIDPDSRGIGGDKLYIWLAKNDYPPGFQVLCMNCNWGKGRNGGVCPHQAARWPSDSAIHFQEARQCS